MSGADERLTVDASALLVGVSTKTIRRAILDGRLPAEKVTGRHGGYRITRQDLEALYVGERAAERPVSPVEALTAKIDELLEITRDQAAKIGNLESEVRDSRAQLHQFQETYLKALPARTPARWWQFWKRETGRE